LKRGSSNHNNPLTRLSHNNNNNHNNQLSTLKRNVIKTLYIWIIRFKDYLSFMPSQNKLKPH
jgi:hypothetical protein